MVLLKLRDKRTILKLSQDIQYFFLLRYTHTHTSYYFFDGAN